MTAEQSPRVIATRDYRAASGVTLTARLFEPVAGGPDHWTCAFTISGLLEEIRDRGHGIDALQAIGVALAGLRWHLEKSGEVLTMAMHGEDAEPGHLGIPRTIPDSFGVEIEERLFALVQAESTRLVHEAVAARRGNRR